MKGANPRTPFPVQQHMIAGTRLGPYEIIGLVGEGGMGQVYKARDTRLDRLVAIKMLPATLAGDPVRRERFEREARNVSKLDHPHICPLYDVGEHEGHLYLVMQFLEGETLAERLHRGPMPIRQTLEYGLQIADALAAAHRAGIVHRDLKPGNVMITRSGARLLDFGLARTVPLQASFESTAGGSPGSSTLTTEGTILGTLSYMAPEQIDGRPVDTRADVFAFGAVLFEMVTGLKAFDGESPARVMSAILRDEPARVSTIVPVTPAALEALIHACLAKDPNDRWQNVGDVARQLRHLREMMSAGKSGSLELSGAVPRTTMGSGWLRSRPRVLVWSVVAVAAALGIAALAPLITRMRQGTEPARAPLRLRALLLPPAGMYLADTLALAPDGRRLAFVASDATGRRRLWMRDLEAATPRALEGTEDASDPFWSPDGRHIAFFSERRLKRVAADGGPVTMICESGAGAGGSWNLDDVIIFSPLDGPLMRVAATGGRPEPIATLDQHLAETHHLYPSFLPDGRHYVYYVAGRERGLYAGTLGSTERKRLFDPDPTLPAGAAATPGIYAESGHLLYVRDRVLTARRFDPVRLEVSGEPMTVVETVDYDPPGQAAFTIANGVLVYRTRQHRPTADLAWVDRSGRTVATSDMPPGTFRTISLSPDGRTIAVDRRDAQGVPSVWLVDAASGTSERLPSTYWSGDALWSPDGRSLVYSIADETPPNLVVRGDRGKGAERRLTRASADQQYATSFTPDGRSIVFEAFSRDTGWDLHIVSADGGVPQRVLQTRANETTGRVSPDGRWLAYVSDDSGRREIYLTAFPELQGRTLVSSGGGSRPFWRADGAELFYLGADGQVLAVAVRSAGRPGAGERLLSPASPVTLFKAEIYGGIFTPDAAGQRFLVARPAAAADLVPLEVFVNPLAR